MAEGILRKLADDAGISGIVESVSAGTMNMVGVSASDYAVSVAAEYGVDISQHRSQGATRKLLYSADLVLALADEHFEFCRDLEVPSEKLYMLRSFPQQTSHLREMSVEDPIGQHRRVYQEVFFEIDEALRKSLPEIVKRARAKTGRTGD